MKIVEQMPKREGFGASKYPWAEWFDGKVRLLEQGVDFDVEPQSLSAQTSGAAKKFGVKVSTRIRPEGLYMQAHPLPQKR